jgi:hypothetical protein
MYVLEVFPIQVIKRDYLFGNEFQDWNYLSTELLE